MILLVFWVFSGSVLEHYQEFGQVVYSAQYCTMLEEELKPTVCSKHRGMLTNGVVLHHDNAQPLIVAATIETI
jgi:hypothetical protein